MSKPSRPTSIPGYEHPTTMAYSRKGVYKTFTEGKKARKKEKFGRTTAGNSYARQESYMGSHQVEELCPVCSNRAFTFCDCVYNDKKCAEGHVWYTDREGKTIKSNPHEK